MQKFINIDKKGSGRKQTNDKLREQKLNTMNSLLRLRLNFLKFSSFRLKFSKHKARCYQGFRQFQQNSAEIFFAGNGVVMRAEVGFWCGKFSKHGEVVLRVAK